jgi:hypothetical protein
MANIVLDQNERLMEYWQELPTRVPDQVWVQFWHYLIPFWAFPGWQMRRQVAQLF